MTHHSMNVFIRAAKWTALDASFQATRITTINAAEHSAERAAEFTAVDATQHTAEQTAEYPTVDASI